MVASDSPTGESSSSAMVKTRINAMRPSSGTVFGSVLAIGMKTRKAMPITIVPMANFSGVDG